VAKNKDSIQYVFTVAFAVCMVCAIVVATSAVVLRPLQVENKARDLKRNILASAGLMEEGTSGQELVASIESRLVTIRDGQFSTDFDVDSFDAIKAVSDPK
jgi:Na+-transporting NADH:ubiquinone oxidoreductase subunit C